MLLVLNSSKYLLKHRILLVLKEVNEAVEIP